MLFGEVIAFHSGNTMKHINTLCEKNAKSFNIKAGGTYITHSALKQHFPKWEHPPSPQWTAKLLLGATKTFADNKDADLI
jgi:hypothetical protein